MTESVSPNSNHEDMQQYQSLIQQYEVLDQKIQALLAGSDAARSDQMSDYRALARERDEVFSELRALEHSLRLDE